MAMAEKQKMQSTDTVAAIAEGLPYGEAGTSSGINIKPGDEDDGWVVPQPVVLSDGTQIQLYKDGEALHAAYEAIAAARHRICLEIYIFHSDETGWAFADLLCQKASEGVGVYLIYDSFGSIDTDSELFRKMRAAGVKLQEFHPMRPWDCRFSWRPANRDHRKLLVIDNDIAGLGGLNIGGAYGGSWVHKSKAPCKDLWRDNAIGIRGPQARLFLRAFAKAWHYLGSGGPIGQTELIHNLDKGELGVLASVPTRSSPLLPFLHRIMREAKKSIHLTMAYFAPADEMIEELCRAARRGVRVKLMLPGRCDVKLLQIAARSFYEKLLNAGVQIFERQDAVLHTKAIVIDGQTTVLGSTNLDYRSIEYNCELSALVRSELFGCHMRNLFLNDMKFARRITLGEWRHRPTWDRFVQWAVSRARYVL